MHYSECNFPAEQDGDMKNGSVRILPATLAHVQALRGRLRKQDKDELLAATGMNSDSMLQESFFSSCKAWVPVKGDIVLGIFGVAASPIEGIGHPWLLGTEEIMQEVRAFVTLSRMYVQKMEALYPCLMNVVDVRNTLSQRWLRWCGFHVETTPVAHGPFGLPFVWFYKGKNYV